MIIYSKFKPFLSYFTASPHAVNKAAAPPLKAEKETLKVSRLTRVHFNENLNLTDCEQRNEEARENCLIKKKKFDHSGHPLKENIL